MNMVFHLTLIFSLAFAYIREGQLYELFDTDYKTFLSEFQTDLRVIWYYSPFFISIGKDSSFDYFNLAKELKDLPIRFAKVNMDSPKNPELKEKYSNSIPSIMYCLGHTDICTLYTLEKSKEVMKKFFLPRMHKQEKLEKIEDLDERFENSAWVLGVFEEFEGKKFEAFLDFTYKFVGQFNFAFVKDDGQWAVKFGLTGDSLLVVHGKNLRTDVYPYYYSLGNFKSLAEIEKFVKWTVHPYVSYVDKITFKDFKTDKVPLGVLYLNMRKFSLKVPFFVQKFAENSKEKLPLLNEPKKYQLAIADYQEFTSELQDLNIVNTDMVFLLHYQDKVYKLDQHCFYDGDVFIGECIKKFYKEYELQKVSVHLKSEPLPVLVYDKGVKVAVGNNFKALVENKEVFHVVFVYRLIDSEYKTKILDVENLAEEYKKNFRVDFIKINAERNSVPADFKVGENSKLFITGKKRGWIRDFGGQWSYSRLQEFINEAVEIKKPDL